VNAIEIKVTQKERLFSLLTIKAASQGTDLKMLDALDKEIRRAIAGMDEADIAHVEKLVAQES